MAGCCDGAKSTEGLTHFMFDLTRTISDDVSRDQGEPVGDLADPQAPRHELLPATQRYKRHKERRKRYEKPQPGHRVQVDVKFVAPIGGTKRKHHQFTAIDDCTRVRVLRVYDHLNQKTAIQFIDYVFEKLPFRVEVIQTDNGADFQSAFLECFRRELVGMATGACPMESAGSPSTSTEVFGRAPSPLFHPTGRRGMPIVVIGRRPAHPSRRGRLRPRYARSSRLPRVLSRRAPHRYR